MNGTAATIEPTIPDSRIEATIRRARLDDASAIHELLAHYASREKLLPRAESDIYQSLREFLVAESDGRVVGCGALQIFTRELGEIRSLAIEPGFQGHRFGTRLVTALEEDARLLGLTRLMALTYEVEFFNSLDYQVVAMKQLPEKVWGACINCPKFRNCDEIAVLKHLPVTA